jgi:hypothetical protein
MKMDTSQSFDRDEEEDDDCHACLELQATGRRNGLPHTCEPAAPSGARGLVGKVVAGDVEVYGTIKGDLSL